MGIRPIDLSGVRLRDGVEFEFSQGAVGRLGPGERVVVVRDRQAFAARYGAGINIAGEFTSGGLNNRGEQISLEDGNGNLLLQFTYADSGAWPDRADGLGSTLELIDMAGADGDPANWRASAEYGGSPGRVGTGPVASVVINELLSNSVAPRQDAIELHNPTSTAIDVSGWLLSDALDNLRKFAIPAQTVISPGGYVSFDQSQFGASGRETRDVVLSGAHGGQLWLVQADSQGRILRFVDHVQFGTASADVSLGRWPDGLGPLYAMDQLTLGGKNSRPRAGEVIISEVHYHPLDMDGAGNKKPDDFEYLELYNRTGATVDVGGWHITGIDYTFPPATTISAGQTALLVRFDPATAVTASAFRFLYGVDPSVPLLGPFDEPLSDEGMTLRLQRPDAPPPDEPDFVPIVGVDEIVYTNAAPWPTGAGGTGQSLTPHLVHGQGGVGR